MNEEEGTSALALEPEGVAADVARLGPYARAALERAARHALRLHAEEISPQHLLTALFLDEEAGATRLVLYAFADPETLAIELLALSPGIMVVGSGRSLPFSVRGVRALEAARALAAEGGATAVTPAHVLGTALEQLGPDDLAVLAKVGLDAERARAAAREPVPGEAEPVPATGPLFHRFRQDTRRALGAAARAAGQWSRDAIAPAHLVLGALEASAELGEALGTRAARVRMALGGRDADPTPLAPRRLRPDDELRALLAALEDGADTVRVLGRVLAEGSEEVRLLLQRQKVTFELFQRAHASFSDPAPDPA